MKQTNDCTHSAVNKVAGGAIVAGSVIVAGTGVVIVRLQREEEIGYALLFEDDDDLCKV